MYCRHSPSIQHITVVQAGRPGRSEVTSLPSDTLGREFDPGKRDFSHKIK